MTESNSQAAAYKPIAVGFLLLSLPLVAAIFLTTNFAGRMTNALAAGVMICLGLLLLRRQA